MAADEDPGRGRSVSRKARRRPSSGEDEERRGDRSASPAPERRARPQRFGWRDSSVWDARFEEAGIARGIVASIRQTFRRIGDLAPYAMAGDESAVTTVGDRVFKTKDQMHSEMCAIAATAALQPASDELSVASNPRSVAFSTEQPHCGYCTFFLAKLDLPLSAPTCGLFNLAGNCEYPLPDCLKTNPAFLASVCDIDVDTLVRRINFIYVNSGVAAWAVIKANPAVMRHFWGKVFACLNAVLPKLH